MVRVRVRVRRRLEEGGVSSAITTLNKKACEGLLWLYAVFRFTPTLRLRLRLRLEGELAQL